MESKMKDPISKWANDAQKREQETLSRIKTEEVYGGGTRPPERVVASGHRGG